MLHRSGIGKAVRSAVDEVHKRAQEIRDTPTPSPPPRAYQQRRSQSSLGPYALQDRIKSLEDRSKHLAKLLQGALGELMEYHKQVNALDEKTEYPSAEDLGVAIAKVQFVQVYLDDPKLLLPTDTSTSEDPLQAGTAGSDDPLQSVPATDEKKTTDSTKVDSRSADGEGRSSSNVRRLAGSATAPTESHVAGLADPSAFDDIESNTATPAILVDKVLERSLATQESVEDQGQSARPRLDQSSYSWMLGEQNSLSTERSRNKASLFGEDTGKVDVGSSNQQQSDSFDIGNLRHGKR